MNRVLYPTPSNGTDPLLLARADLRAFASYQSARSEKLLGDVWLNANEAAWPNEIDRDDALRRYPEPQPAMLRAALAELYGVTTQQLLIGRGSDEGIDLLVRGFCSPNHDAILITPPVFGMYAVGARLHGAGVVEVALQETEVGFQLDFETIARSAIEQRARLVFLCSPHNPTGVGIDRHSILTLAKQLEDHALLVLDEAYVEFSQIPSLVGDVAGLRNLVVLRTLSKAHALAAARIGCVIADPAVIAFLSRCQAPYPVPIPCAALAMAAISPSALQLTQTRITQLCRERERVDAAMRAMPCVHRVYASQANYLLVRFHDAQSAFDRLLAAAVVVRDQRAAPQLGDALRISIGTAEENDRMLAALCAAPSSRSDECRSPSPRHARVSV